MMRKPKHFSVLFNSALSYVVVEGKNIDLRAIDESVVINFVFRP